MKGEHLVLYKELSRYLQIAPCVYSAVPSRGSTHMTKSSGLTSFHSAGQLCCRNSSSNSFTSQSSQTFRSDPPSSPMILTVGNFLAKEAIMQRWAERSASVCGSFLPLSTMPRSPFLSTSRMMPPARLAVLIEDAMTRIITGAVAAIVILFVWDKDAGDLFKIGMRCFRRCREVIAVKVEQLLAAREERKAQSLATPP